MLLLRCLGERLSPRWRFLLWGVVLARLLFVATPVSPWSVFNLVRWNPQANARPIDSARGRCNVQAGAAQVRLANRPVRNERGIAASCRLCARVYRHAGECAPGVAVHFLRDRDAIDAVHQGSVRCRLDHADPVVVLAGGLSVLWVEASGNRTHFASASFGLPPGDGCRAPGLPGNIPPPARTQTHSRVAGHARTRLSPCIVGTWNPRIVLPESVVTRVFDRAGLSCAGARAGASGAR